MSERRVDERTTPMRILPLLLVTALTLAACGDTARLGVEAGVGPAPVLPKPVTAAIPTVEVADATGWSVGQMPVAAPGLRVQPFAEGLDHPRWLHILPNGDVLVAETASPGTDKSGKGTIKGFFMKMFMKKAGSAVPSANRISLLRDANGDGVAETRTILVSGLYSPFGMALLGGQLFVANADALVRFPFKAGMTQIAAPPVKVASLPAGWNHHWTKSLVASPDGRWLFVGVGSNSNVGENGMAMEQGRAAIWRIDPRTGASQIFAGGLRNPVGLAFNPWSGALWTAVNERDELGSDLVPDYITSVREGGFYGWPYSYYGRHVDVRVKPPRPDLVARAIVPDYAMGPHVAALGLAFSRGQRLGPHFRQGAFVGEHGSWNRNPPSGYKVVFVPFSGARPSGMPVDVLVGFMRDGKAFGRPVGVEIAGDGSLLVADDVGNKVWRVSSALPQPVASR
jgi:glucose/arabinose dehydrogenase